MYSLPLVWVALHFQWSDNYHYFQARMSWGQFQGNHTHQLHLKEILPVFKLTHISEFSNSLTSAVDSLCSHGFTHMLHLCNISFKGCSPHLRQPQISPSPQKPSQETSSMGFKAISQSAPHIRRLKMITLQKRREKYERKDYICLNCQTKLWGTGPPENDSDPHDVFQGRCFHGRGSCVFGSLARGYANFNS